MRFSFSANSILCPGEIILQVSRPLTDQLVERLLNFLVSSTTSLQLSGPAISYKLGWFVDITGQQQQQNQKALELLASKSLHWFHVFSLKPPYIFPPWLDNQEDYEIEVECCLLSRMM